MSYMSNLDTSLSQLVAIAKQHHVKNAYISGNTVIVESYYSYRENGQLLTGIYKDVVSTLKQLLNILGY